MSGTSHDIPSSTDASSTIPTTTTPIPSLISINPAAQLPLKLNGTNYPTWRAQFETLLFGYDLLGYIDGTLKCPSAQLRENGVSRQNPSYLPWLRQDSFLRHAILASVDPHISPMVTNVQTAKEAWDKLRVTYANKSQTRIYGLRNSLAKSSKNSQSVTEYMRTIKSISDELALAGSPLNDDELVITVLSGLPDEYKEISAAIRARDSPISFPELFDKLVDHESFLNRHSSPKDSNVITAHFSNKGNGRGKGYNNKKNSGQNGGNYQSGFKNSSPQSSSNGLLGQAPSHGSFFPQNSTWRPPYNNVSAPKVQCQLCDKFGHVAKNCRSRPPPYMLPQAHFLHHDMPNSQSSWVLDSGASHHITSDLQNLSVHSGFSGNDGVLIGDGLEDGGGSSQRPE